MSRTPSTASVRSPSTSRVPVISRWRRVGRSALTAVIAYQCSGTGLALAQVAPTSPAVDPQQTTDGAQGDEDIRRATEEYERGYALRAGGKYVEAAAAFEKSQSFVPGPGTLVLLGDCYEHLGDLLRARNAYERALVDAKNYQSEEILTSAAKKGLDRVEAELAAVTLGAPPAPNAQALINGNAVPTGQPTWLKPGRYELQAQTPEKKSQVTPFEVVKGQRLTLPFPALADAIPPPKNDVIVDGDVPPPAAGPWPEYLPWALTIGGGVLVVGSLIPGLSAKSKESDALEACPDKQRCSEAVRDDVDSAKTLALVTDVMWIAGVLVAGAGATLFILDSQRESEPTAGVQAGCLATGCSVLVHGRF